MAQLIPPQPAGRLLLGALKLHAALKTLPDTWAVWQNMRNSEGADFLALHRPSMRTFLLRAWRSSKAEVVAGKSVQPDLASLSSVGSDTLFGALVSRVLTHHDVDTVPPELAEDLVRHDLSFLGRSDLREGALEARLDALSKPGLTREWFDDLRVEFAPEGLLDHTATIDRFEAREAGVVRRRSFLDFRQEVLAKRDLGLPDEQSALVGEFGVRLLTGVAGSGKTLVLLHRALLLAKRFPRYRIAILTFNKPLGAELVRRLRSLDRDTHIECQTFHRWCWKIWKTQGYWSHYPESRKRATIRELSERFFPGHEAIADHLASELDWIHDQGLRTWDEYRQAERRGRGFRLSAAQREGVWKACVEWRDFLDRGQHGDFPHFGYRFHVALSEGLKPTALYDAILIDEAQFFAPVWFDVVRRHLKPSGTLFLAADPSQGFLRHGTSWRTAGIHVRGHSDRLSRSYRTTRAIMEFAWSFLVERVPEASEDTVFPDLSRMDDGQAPVVLQALDLDAQIRRCAHEIEEALGEGFRPRDFLVLTGDPHGIENLGRILHMHGVPVGKADSLGEEDAVRLCSLDTATGLEAPVVYVLGVSQILEAESNPLLDPEDREILRERDARRLYMAFTRAGCVLRIGWSGPLPPAWESRVEVGE
ncbi:MAG: DEAD/DEAH box helicase [Fibrobacteria bacterium]|nr:DEAD/DEAH box helicase [Fibrobacteria bacterium]